MIWIDGVNCTIHHSLNVEWLHGWRSKQWKFYFWSELAREKILSVIWNRALENERKKQNIKGCQVWLPLKCGVHKIILCNKKTAKCSSQTMYKPNNTEYQTWKWSQNDWNSSGKKCLLYKCGHAVKNVAHKWKFSLVSEDSFKSGKLFFRCWIINEQLITEC